MSDIEEQLLETMQELVTMPAVETFEKEIGTVLSGITNSELALILGKVLPDLGQLVDDLAGIGEEDSAEEAINHFTTVLGVTTLLKEAKLRVKEVKDA